MKQLDTEKTEEEKKEEQKKAANERRKKADRIRKQSGLKTKRVHLHQETLNDLKALAEMHGFNTSDSELGYDELSCLVTLLADLLWDKSSFNAVDYETAMLKRLHLTVKHCQYEDDSINAMDMYEISELLREYSYTLQEEILEFLLGREATESDFEWSDDVINALADEERVRSTILCLANN
ncbi:hypothetical protein [Vibrio alginolyticus]